MKTNLLIIAACALLPVSFLHAEEEKSAAIRLVELMEFSENAKSTATTAFQPMLQQLKAQGLPDEALTEVTESADRYFTKTFSDPAIEADLAKVYENIYSEDEMEELILFYNTPIGKKTLVTMPQVMQDSMAVGQKYAMKNQPEFQAEIGAIMQKYAEQMQPKPAPAPAAPEPAPAPAE